MTTQRVLFSCLLCAWQRDPAHVWHQPHCSATLPQYAAMLPAMLEFADSRKWVLLHDQASNWRVQVCLISACVTHVRLPSVGGCWCHPNVAAARCAGAGGAVLQV